MFVSKRFNNLSIYRIIVTIAVVQFHIFYIFGRVDGDYTLLLSKGAVGLAALSGFIYATKQIKYPGKFIKNRLARLLIPAVFATLIVLLWNLIYMLTTGSSDFGAQWFSYRAAGKILLFQLGNFYFIGYIIVCYLMLFLLRYNNKLINIILLLACLGVECVIGYYYFGSFILTSFLICYFLGKKYFVSFTSGKIDGATLFYSGAAIIVALLGFTAVIHLPKLQPKFVSNMVYVLRSLTLDAFALASFFFIINLLKPLNRFNINKLFSFTDGACYSIFLMDQCFMIGSMNVAAYSNNYSIQTILIYVFTISGGLVVYLLSQFVSKHVFFRKNI